MRKIPFTKMSGAGNDFVLVEAGRLPRGLPLPALARRLCERREGVGADGLLVLKRRGKGRVPELDYYNADGSRAFCGNGSRCAAWYMRLQGWGGKRLRFSSISGNIEAAIVGRERVRLRMPDARGLRRGLKLKAAGKSWRVDALDTGVPHAVVRVKGLKRFPVEAVGRALRRHPAFGPKGANVNFVEPGPRRVAVRTYERGVEDETLACGTGVVASAILSCAWTGRRPPVRVAARGGLLSVGFRPNGGGRFKEVWLEGPARATYRGEIAL